MGLFSRTFGALFGDEQPLYGENVPQIEEAFERLASWTTGRRMADAGEKYASMIRRLPEGDATSMRLSEAAGTMTIDGEQSPVVFGFPGALELNMPTLTGLAGTARILVDLGYEGIEDEARGILHDLNSGGYRMRVSCIPARSYPLVRLQISFYSDLQEPLHLEVLSDLLDCNVQDFYTAFCQSGRYELSLHVVREHIGSVFASYPGEELVQVRRCVAGEAVRLAAIEPEERNMELAVRECERRHPLGEGMRRGF
ncbi:hypothetical protein CR163_004935 [Prosthecochloris sp. ZM_2]|uniref:hypothetical protein n=1 Tax=Prosthecochloris sp. ZM_2 TaxID=2045206 RepID=UPI000DF77634|nr:hypothetical protein [Prosthecochloris sp. ZM_2]RNA64641.1 hypothetical protein CR163_004935 [Prosthecochloris sp. ZM_2]